MRALHTHQCEGLMGATYFTLNIHLKQREKLFRAPPLLHTFKSRFCSKILPEKQTQDLGSCWKSSGSHEQHPGLLRIPRPGEKEIKLWPSW